MCNINKINSLNLMSDWPENKKTWAEMADEEEEDEENTNTI